MAQYFTDFSEYADGDAATVLNDWSLFGGAGRTITVESDAGATGGKLLRVSTTLSDVINHILQWDRPGSWSGRIDMLFRFRRVGLTTSNTRVGAFFYGANNAADRYDGQRLLANSRVVEWPAGTTLSNQTMSNLAVDTWTMVRVRTNSGAHGVKSWVDGDPEPGTFDTTAADVTLTSGTVGLMGIAIWGSGGPFLLEYDWFGVGTDGDDAPTESVGTLQALSGSIAGTAGLGGGMSLGLPLSGSLDGLAGLSAALVTRKELAGQLAGVAALGGNLTHGLGLSGAVQGAGQLEGMLRQEVELAGLLSGAGNLSGNLENAVRLGGSLAALAQLEGRLGLRAGMSGTLAGAAALEAILSYVQPGGPYRVVPVADGYLILAGADALAIEPGDERYEVVPHGNG